MRIAVVLGGTAAALVCAATSLAQPPPVAAPGAVPIPPTMPIAPLTGRRPHVLVRGAPVRDRNGATVGEVADIQRSPDGVEIAVIRVGADHYAVDASSLVFDQGVARTDESLAEIRARLAERR